MVADLDRGGVGDRRLFIGGNCDPGRAADYTSTAHCCAAGGGVIA
jgi:hypothetical protein